MQACSNLPGRAHGLTRLFHASSTSRGCRVSHTAQPGPSGDRQVRHCHKTQYLSWFPSTVPCTTLGLWKSRGMRKRRGTHPCEGWSCAVQGWQDPAGWRAPRTKQAAEMCPLPPRELPALLWKWGTSFPTALAQGESPTCSAPQKSQPRCAAAAVNRPILMHITPNITTGGTRPLPRNPPRPSAAKCSRPWPPPAACREAGLGCFSIGRASGFSSIPAAW